MNVCKAVSRRAVSWNSNAKTTSIQLLKFGCNVVIFKSCLQAIDTLVTVSEILILKIKAVATSNLLSFSEKEWAALLQSQLFCYQNKQKQHWHANVPLNWKLHCRHFICMSDIFFSALKMVFIMVYCLVSPGIRFGYFMVLAVSLGNDLFFSLSWRNPDLLLPVSARPKSPSWFCPSFHSWQCLIDFPSLCALSISAASCLNLLIKIKLNSTEEYLLP